jgi:hypothetical protein
MKRQLQARVLAISLANVSFIECLSENLEKLNSSISPAHSINTFSLGKSILAPTVCKKGLPKIIGHNES